LANASKFGNFIGFQHKGQCFFCQSAQVGRPKVTPLYERQVLVFLPWVCIGGRINLAGLEESDVSFLGRGFVCRFMSSSKFAFSSKEKSCIFNASTSLFHTWCLKAFLKGIVDEFYRVPSAIVQCGFKDRVGFFYLYS